HAGSLLPTGLHAWQELPELLEDAGLVNPWRWHGPLVQRLTAAQLASGAWQAFAPEQPRARYHIPVHRPAGPDAAPAFSPSSLRAPVAEAPSAPPPAGEDEPFDQDAQAAALVQAASTGTPFCEVCEQQARQRQAQGAGAQTEPA
ncbi:MAG: hypothetical protein QM742_08280, partial [Aquabacterium sp.]